MVFLDVSPLQTCVSLKFTDKNFKQPNCFWLSMHAYRILLPSETDDSRFNSREKHTLTDSVQPYNWPRLFGLHCEISKPRSDISQYRPHARSISLYYYTRYKYIERIANILFTLITPPYHTPHPTPPSWKSLGPETVPSFCKFSVTKILIFRGFKSLTYVDTTRFMWWKRMMVLRKP